MVLKEKEHCLFGVNVFLSSDSYKNTTVLAERPVTQFADQTDTSDNDDLATGNLCYFCNPMEPCFIYALFILYPCFIHALSMLDPCFIHALSMLDPCFIHALSMLDPWLTMLYSCFIHALSMLYSCFIHALSMLYPCFIYAYPCVIHAYFIHCLITGARWGEEKMFYKKQNDPFSKRLLHVEKSR